MFQHIKEMDLLLFGLTFAVLFILGMPIAFAMISSTLVYAFMNHVDLGFLGMQMFTSLNNFVFVAIPLFMLTAEVMERSSVSDRIFKFANSLVGYISGGLGHVNVLTSIIFAGMSGSSVADVGGIGHLCCRAMVNAGYDEDFSAATTITSSIIGPIIPPSIPMIIYAMVSGASVGKLFFGGAMPGLLFGLILMVYIYFVSKKRKYPKQTAPAFKVMVVEFLASFVVAILPLLTPVILLGCIYFGMVTVTEAAIIATIYTCILGFLVYRKLGIAQLIDSLKAVSKTCAPILLVIPAAKIFGYVLTAERVQEGVSRVILGIAGNNPLSVLFVIGLLFLILGCISDAVVNIMLFVPAVLPLVNSLGINPIHFGVLIVFNCMVGLATPPIGTLLMAVSALERIPFERLVKAMLPYFVICIGMLALLTIFPQITTFLPNLLFNK